MSSPAEVLERIFTTRNPETGSMPPEKIAFAVFENGTVYFSAPTVELPDGATHEMIAEEAREALTALGPVVAGTPSADFNPVRLSGWFPDEPVWFVAYDHPMVATVVVMNAPPLVAGMMARGNRDLDLASLMVVTTRTFAGELRERS